MVFHLLSTEPNTFQYALVVLSTAFVIILGIFNLMKLHRKRKQIPFSNISPVYLMFTYTGNYRCLIYSIIDKSNYIDAFFFLLR